MGGIQFLPLLAAAKVKQVSSLRLSHLQAKASVWTTMGKSQSKDEVKEAGVNERKESERFVSTYCKAMRSLFLLFPPSAQFSSSQKPQHEHFLFLSQF